MRSLSQQRAEESSSHTTRTSNVDSLAEFSTIDFGCPNKGTGHVLIVRIDNSNRLQALDVGILAPIDGRVRLILIFDVDIGIRHGRYKDLTAVRLTVAVVLFASISVCLYKEECKQCNNQQNNLSLLFRRSTSYSPFKEPGLKMTMTPHDQPKINVVHASSEQPRCDTQHVPPSDQKLRG